MTTYNSNGEIEPTEVGGPLRDTDRETGEAFVPVPIEPIRIGGPLRDAEVDPLPGDLRIRPPSPRRNTR